jgi:hypothetical protein
MGNLLGFLCVIGAGYVGCYAGILLARIMGLWRREVEVGRVGDQPVIEYQITTIGRLLALLGMFAGVCAGLVGLGMASGYLGYQGE